MAKAKENNDKCTKCDGTGCVNFGPICQKCEGTGKAVAQADGDPAEESAQ